MSHNISKKDLVDALRELGAGDSKTVGIVSDLSMLGNIEAADGRSALANCFDSVCEVMGGDGTIVVPTFTYRRLGEGSPYLHADSASETGSFTEFVRRMADSVRSLHPVFSYAAIGPDRNAICENASAHSYGWSSPAQRMIEADAIMISLGLPPHRGTFLLHVAERAVGVPYRYTKELSIPVYVGDRKISKPFFHFVKYSDCDLVWDTNRVIDLLETQGKLKYRPLGNSGIWAYRAKDLFRTTVNLLDRNIFGLLAHAPKIRPWKN